MTDVLIVDSLSKEYPKFRLQDVSFRVRAGEIMGFIGRNGAGKSTTLKCLLNLVHPSGGKITFFGLDFAENEREIKQKIGFAAGGVNYYMTKQLKTIAETTKTFYANWNDAAYRRYLRRFELDENKKLKELSDGMKVKFNLALALSHESDLLILDEPTSGLDPVSREELLTIFKELANDGIAIIFSTHITFDLDKCADSITYIKQGKIVASDDKTDFISRFGGGNLEDIMLRIEKGESL